MQGVERGSSLCEISNKVLYLKGEQPYEELPPSKKEVRMKALLEQQGLVAALEELPAATIVAYHNVIQKKAYIALILCLGDRVLREITKEMTATGDLAAINAAISNEDQALLLFTSLPSSYDNFVETFLYGRDSLKLEVVLAKLNSRELQKMMEAKGDGGKGLYVRGRSGQRYMKQDQVSSSRTDGYDNADVMMAMSVEELLDWIMDSGGSYHITYKKDYLVDFEEYEGGNILLGDGRECRVRRTCKVQVQMRANCVYTLDGQALTRKTLKGRKQLGEYQTGWKIKMGLRQQNGLVEEKNVKLLAKVCCPLIQSGLSTVLWANDITMSTYLVNRSPLSVIRFNTPIDMLRFYNGKLVHTLLVGHSILSLEGSLSVDYDVEKSGIKSAKNGEKFFGTSVVVFSSSTDLNWPESLVEESWQMEFEDGLDMATIGFILDDNEKLKRLKELGNSLRRLEEFIVVVTNNDNGNFVFLHGVQKSKQKRFEEVLEGERLNREEEHRHIENSELYLE
nr:retrovirus-related Pol polyprotein from transposon TNT 1-94 [Tanacetum cinerariifolium]